MSPVKLLELLKNKTLKNSFKTYFLKLSGTSRTNKKEEFRSGVQSVCADMGSIGKGKPTHS